MESIQNQLLTNTNYKERHQSDSATEEQSEEGKVKEILFFPSQSMALPSLGTKSLGRVAFGHLMTRAFNNIYSHIVFWPFLGSSSGLWKARITSNKVPEDC